MFGRIAPRYDLLNHLLSMNIDRHWRALTVARVSHILSNPEARVLDACCGTGDLMLALETRGAAHVYGSDFCHPMLTAAHRKVEQRGFRSALFEADALRLPLADSSLDLVTAAFGFRNLANYQRRIRGTSARAAPGRDGGDSRIFHAAESAARADVQLLLSDHSSHHRRIDLRIEGSLFVPSRIGPQISGRRSSSGADARRRIHECPV